MKFCQVTRFLSFAINYLRLVNLSLSSAPSQDFCDNKDKNNDNSNESYFDSNDYSSIYWGKALI